MSDIGGVVFIIGLVGVIPTAGKMMHTFVKDQDIKPVELILVVAFIMMLIVGANN